MIRLDYKQTDSKIEIDIYGLVFEINKKEIESIDQDKIKEIENMDELIDKILGDGAVEKINLKREADGYSKIDTQVGLTIVSACAQTYVNASTKPITDIVDNYDNVNRKIDNFKNRNQRRYYRYRRY